MTNNNWYKFVGVINFFGVYPDFVYPIFENDGKYYFQRCENCTIKSFNEIKDNLFLKMVLFMDSNVSMSIKIKSEYLIGDEPVIAFQLDKNNYFISDSTNFIPFISNFDTEDEILREEIDTLLDKINFKKNQEKKKRKLLNNLS